MRCNTCSICIDIFDLSIVEEIAHVGLCRLKMFPPEFLNTLMELNPSDFGRLGISRLVRGAFKIIHNMVCQSFLQASFSWT
jgi:hypothetical protein